MVSAEFETYLSGIGLSVQDHDLNGEAWMILKGLPIKVGTHKGCDCDVALRRSAANPWQPEAQVHVRPHLVAMGQHSSQPSPLGEDWQYLSRRFDLVPTPAAYLAFIRSALEEL